VSIVSFIEIHNAITVGVIAMTSLKRAYHRAFFKVSVCLEAITVGCFGINSLYRRHITEFHKAISVCKIAKRTIKKAYNRLKIKVYNGGLCKVYCITRGYHSGFYYDKNPP
jgi:hypothetical protein